MNSFINRDLAAETESIRTLSMYRLLGFAVVLGLIGFIMFCATGELQVIIPVLIVFGLALIPILGEHVRLSRCMRTGQPYSYE